MNEHLVSRHKTGGQASIEYLRKPAWIKSKLPFGVEYNKVNNIVKEHKLHTVCHEAACPNVGECWGSGTATFLILGDICTRNCRFCNVGSGMPSMLDLYESVMIKEAVEKLGLNYIIITSVTRDDLYDGGARHFAEVLIQLRSISDDLRIELLIPDFNGSYESIERVIKAGPDVLGHNIETVPRLYNSARPVADYKRSLEVLRYSKQCNPDIITKSALLLGLGEKYTEIIETIRDLYDVRCDILYLGQYLSPSKTSFPVQKYYTPQEFDLLMEIALSIGFRVVKSTPLMRSSYAAVDAYEEMKKHE